MPKRFSVSSDSTNSSPQQVSEARAAVLPLAHRKEPSLGGRAARKTHPAPRFLAARGVGCPALHLSPGAARVPRPGRGRKQPHNNQGDRTGRPRPGAHRLGATPRRRRAARCPNPRARGERRKGGGEGRRAGKEGRAARRGARGGLRGARSGGAGAGGGRPGRALPSSCPRSGSKRSTGT